jgi:4,4'-diaponeurosporenoate glycosyltransferase
VASAPEKEKRMSLSLASFIAFLAISALFYARLSRPRLPPGHDKVPALPRIDIVIPARNEAETICGLLESLKNQAGADFSVFVVDDGSDDGTGERASGAGATVRRVERLPEGWTGKNYACHIGAQAGNSPLILFLDADTRLEPGAVRSIAALHGQYGGALSFLPRCETETAFQACALFFNLAVFQSIRTTRTESGNSVGAFGPCMIVSRADYLAAGGHEADPACIVDDLSLASRIGKLGKPVNCFPGSGMISYRMYRSLSGMTMGFAKNLFSGISRVRRISAFLAVAWITCLLDSFVGLFRGADPLPLVVRAVFVLIDSVILRALLGKIGKARLSSVSLTPFMPLYFIIVFLISSFDTLILRKIRWKGRTFTP